MILEEAQYFEDFPDSKGFIKEHLKAEAIADATSTELQRANELEDPYFLLSAIAKVKFDWTLKMMSFQSKP